jgi:hypothetical protein
VLGYLFFVGDRAKTDLRSISEPRAYIDPGGHSSPGRSGPRALRFQ